MHKVHKVCLKNFKYFFGETALVIDSKNLLIYGENGSGKSSIYWALYTFLHSVFKPDDRDIQKYFEHANDQSLLNRFAAPNETGSIIIEFIDETATVITKTLSYLSINTKSGTLVKEAAASSDFINYRILSRLYDFTNREKIDLFPLFVREILMFINFSVELAPGVTNAADWWAFLEPGQQPKSNINTPEYQDFQSKMATFNQELNNYLLSILQTANEYLQNEFKQDLRIGFAFLPGTYNQFEDGSTTKRNHKTIRPKILLNVEYQDPRPGGTSFNLGRPQSFLNEAKLTAIALSIRFAILEQKNIANATKILVLDDLLISLDMSNREIVLEIILKRFTAYQIILLTHDRSFFELAKHKAKRAGIVEWLYYEMYESQVNGTPQPFIKASDTYLEKAKANFYEKEYEIAGNFLRKQAEAFCKSFLPRKLQFKDDLSPRDLSEMINQCVKYGGECGLTTDVFKDLDGHRKFVLNPASHDSYGVAKFNHEVGNCIRTFEKLSELRFDTTIPIGEKFEFEITGDSDGALYKFEITLDEPAILIKEPGEDSVLSKVKFGHKMYRNGVQKYDWTYTRSTIGSFYKKFYDKSDKAKSADYWDEVVQVSTGQKMQTLRIY
ncbi:MAG: AAA family ATPase [Bacteroidetes bacterium]|nr:AAA family ATPase [Bacteroidota bacterium]